MHYFLPEIGQFFFILCLFYDLKGCCRCFTRELLQRNFILLVSLKKRYSFFSFAFSFSLLNLQFGS